MRTLRIGLSWILLAGILSLSAPGADARTPSDFTLQRAGGGTVTLSALLGKAPVLLVFMATWCQHCGAAVPEINRTQARMAGRLRVLAIDYMERQEKVNAFIGAKNVAYPVALDADGTVARSYGIVGVPTFVLVGRHGILYFGNALPDDIGRYLD